MAMKYITKPVEAIQYTGDNYDEIVEWLSRRLFTYNEDVGNIEAHIDFRYNGCTSPMRAGVIKPYDWLIYENNIIMNLNDVEFKKTYQEYKE